MLDERVHSSVSNVNDYSLYNSTECVFTDKGGISVYTSLSIYQIIYFSFGLGPFAANCAIIKVEHTQVPTRFVTVTDNGSPSFCVCLVVQFCNNCNTIDGV